MWSKLALLTVAALAAAPASAQELVQNGGFETGDFTGWTEFGELTFNGVWHGGPPFPHGGVSQAYFGPETTGGIQQILSANVGDQVTVSFWYVSEGGTTPNSIMASLGSLTLLNQTDVTSLTYQQFTATVTVADLNPVLMFTFSDPLDYLDLDDVSVVLVTGGGSHCESADFNCDGDTGTDLDIETFFACVAGTCPPPPCTNTADFNGDGDVATDADIEAFFRVLAGGPC
jgi:hypothetical protein